MNLSYIINAVKSSASKRDVKRAELFSGAANSNPTTPIEVDTVGYDTATILIGNNTALTASKTTKLRLEGLVDAGGTYQGWVRIPMYYKGNSIDEFSFPGIVNHREALKADVSNVSKIRVVVESANTGLLSVMCELYTGAAPVRWVKPPADYNQLVSQGRDSVKDELVHRGAISEVTATPIEVDSVGYNTAVIEVGHNSAMSGELVIEGSVLYSDTDLSGWERIPFLQGGVVESEYNFKDKGGNNRLILKADVSNYDVIRIRTTSEGAQFIALRVKLSPMVTQINDVGVPKVIFQKTDDYFTSRLESFSSVDSNTNKLLMRPIDVSKYPHLSIIIENNLNVDMRVLSIFRHATILKGTQPIDEIPINLVIKSGKTGLITSEEWDFMREMIPGYIFRLRKDVKEATGSVNIKIIGRQ
ncbi:MAG: hypothetical protein PHR52_05330 [Fermentimonas sp.]|nr:hypothetical protein [Fermentimonas sp.]MDD4696938.1 hypothetical protein [Fermentimonas sp.]